MTIRHHTPNTRLHATRTHLVAVALSLLTTCLALTGCDFLEGNRPDAVAHNTKFLPDLEKPEFLGPPVIDVPWLSLVASWRLEPNGALHTPTVTFSVEQQVAVETLCYDYHGTFKAPGEGQLAFSELIPDLEGKRCEALVEDPVIATLEAATHYKVAESRLLIHSAGQDDPLAFELVAAALGEDDGSSGDDDDASDDGGSDGGSGDDEPKEDDPGSDDGSDDGGSDEGGAGDEEPKEDDSGDDGSDDGSDDDGAGDEGEDKEEDGGGSPPCDNLACSGNGGDDDGGSLSGDDGGSDDGSAGDEEPKEDDPGDDGGGNDGGSLPAGKGLPG